MSKTLIPNPSIADVVTYQIKVGKTVLDSAIELLSLSVTKEINRIPLVNIVIRDGDASERTFEVSNQDLFIPGEKIQIDIGYDGDNSQVFSGIITRHVVKVSGNGDSDLVVECQDAAVKMTLGRKSRYFTDSTDSQVFNELFGEYEGLTIDSMSTSTTHSELVQHHICDWDFLLLRAEANGLLVNVNDGKVSVVTPDTSSDPVLEIAYGSTIMEFEAEMDLRNQLSAVEAVSWDYNNQELFRVTADSAPSFSEHGNISGSDMAQINSLEQIEMHHSGHVKESELQSWADGLILRSRMAKIRGRAVVEGFSGINAGELVKLTGVGERFEGKAYVTAVRHELGQGSWLTTIQFGLDPKRYAFLYKDINPLPAAGLLGCIHGLHTGVVVKLQDDPDGQDRIKVKIPVIDNESEGIWSRIASLDAGENRGAFFRPEIGDEVIVGFINDDPRDAVVLGMLNSSAKPAPLAAEDDNHVKGFTTRSDMNLHFNDDTKTITIKTPADNYIILDEDGTKIEIKDQNDNMMTMDSSGIVIESPKEITIKAGTNLNLEATAELSVNGATVSHEATGNMTIKGSLVKSEASGINEISGSMVKIN